MNATVQGLPGYGLLISQTSTHCHCVDWAQELVFIQQQWLWTPASNLFQGLEGLLESQVEWQEGDNSAPQLQVSPAATQIQEQESQIWLYSRERCFPSTSESWKGRGEEAKSRDGVIVPTWLLFLWGSSGPLIVMIIAIQLTYDSTVTAFHTWYILIPLILPTLKSIVYVSWKPLFPLIQTHIF